MWCFDWFFWGFLGWLNDALGVWVIFWVSGLGVAEFWSDGCMIGWVFVVYVDVWMVVLMLAE